MIGKIDKGNILRDSTNSVQKQQEQNSFLYNDQLDFKKNGAEINTNRSNQEEIPRNNSFCFLNDRQQYSDNKFELNDKIKGQNNVKRQSMDIQMGGLKDNTNMLHNLENKNITQPLLDPINIPKLNIQSIIDYQPPNIS